MFACVLGSLVIVVWTASAMRIMRSGGRRGGGGRDAAGREGGRAARVPHDRGARHLGAHEVVLDVPLLPAAAHLALLRVQPLRRRMPHHFSSSSSSSFQIVPTRQLGSCMNY